MKSETDNTDETAQAEGGTTCSPAELGGGVANC